MFSSSSSSSSSSIREVGAPAWSSSRSVEFCSCLYFFSSPGHMGNEDIISIMFIIIGIIIIMIITIMMTIIITIMGTSAKYYTIIIWLY